MCIVPLTFTSTFTSAVRRTCRFRLHDLWIIFGCPVLGLGPHRMCSALPVAPPETHSVWPYHAHILSNALPCDSHWISNASPFETNWVSKASALDAHWICNALPLHANSNSTALPVGCTLHSHVHWGTDVQHPLPRHATVTPTHLESNMFLRLPNSVGEKHVLNQRPWPVCRAKRGRRSSDDLMATISACKGACPIHPHSISCGSSLGNTHGTLHASGYY